MESARNIAGGPVEVRFADSRQSAFSIPAGRRAPQCRSAGPSAQTLDDDASVAELVDISLQRSRRPVPVRPLAVGNSRLNSRRLSFRIEWHSTKRKTPHGGQADMLHMADAAWFKRANTEIAKQTVRF